MAFRPPALQASGQAVVTLSGTDIYLGPYGTRLSRDNYDRVVGEWLAAGRATPQSAATPGRTIADLVNAFRKSESIPASHAHTYKAVMSILVRLYRRTPVDDFGPLALQVVRQHMVETGWNRSNVNNRTHMVRRIFRWVVSRELVKAGTLDALKAVSGLRRGQTTAAESVPVQPITPEQVEATQAALSPMVSTMVRLQLLTGMRSGELCLMRTADIDASGEVSVYRPHDHKTELHGKTRDVVIGPQGIEILRPWLQPEIDAYIFSPSENEKVHRAARSAARKTPLSCGNRPGTNRVQDPKRTAGNRYTTRTYYRAIYRACDRLWPPPAPLARRKGERPSAWRARLTDAERKELSAWRAAHWWHPHQLRHSFGTLVINRFTAEHAQRSLGHANLKVTQVYAKVALEKAKEVARALG